MQILRRDDKYPLDILAGDTSFVRINLRDGEGAPIDLGAGYTATMGIKRNVLDQSYVVPQKAGTMYDYVEGTQPFTVQFEFSSEDTKTLLEYDGKDRKTLVTYYDIELTEVSTNTVVTVLAGSLTVRRSISGVI